jgi:hypothetical protein
MTQAGNIQEMVEDEFHGSCREDRGGHPDTHREIVRMDNGLDEASHKVIIQEHHEAPRHRKCALFSLGSKVIGESGNRMIPIG